MRVRRPIRSTTVFRSLAQHLALRSSTDLFHTTLIVPDGFDRATFTRHLIESIPTEVGILPQILTFGEFIQQLDSAGPDDFFELTERIQETFPETSLISAAQKAQFLLQLQAFCSRFGQNIEEPPFPLLLLNDQEKQLVALLHRGSPSLANRLQAFFQKNTDDFFIWVDLFPTLPAFKVIRTSFQEAGQDVWVPPAALPKSVSTATFSSTNQEARGIVQALSNLLSAPSGPVIAVITDHADLLQKIEAELLSAEITFKKPKAPTLADSFWGEAALTVAVWNDSPCAENLRCMGTFFMQKATPVRARWFGSFVQRVLQSPSLILNGDLWIPSQADEDSLRWILSQKEEAETPLAQGFEELCALRSPLGNKPSWSEHVAAHKKVWDALRFFWNEEPDTFPDLTDFFAFLQSSTWSESLTGKEYETIVRLLLPSLPASERLAVPEQAAVLLLSSEQALLYDFDVAFFAGMNMDEGLIQTPFPPLLEKPKTWDFLLQNTIIQQATSARSVVMTRTNVAKAQPHRLFNAQPNVPETIDPSIWGAKETAFPERLSAPSAACLHIPKNDLPHTLSISDLQRLKDDPYAFCARKILRLYPPTPPSLSIDYGRWAHDVLHHYFEGGAWAQGTSLTTFFETIQAYHPAVLKRFKPRLKPVLERLENDLISRSPNTVQTEIRLEINFSLYDTIFTVYGIADRIDTKEDKVVLIDYKTGMLPSERALQKLEALQLPVEAFLLKHSCNNQASLSTLFIEMCGLSLKYDLNKPSEVRLPFSAVLDAQTKQQIENLLTPLTQDSIFGTRETAPHPSSEYKHLERIFWDE